MDISVFGGSDSVTVADVVARVRRAAADGLGGIWFPQGAGLDTLTALAVAASEVPGIRLGTAVVPIQGRHPIPLAQQALTVADVAGAGRFTLGIGVTHAPVSEGWYGIGYAGVVELCAEELKALSPLLSASRTAEVTGTRLTARAKLGLAVDPPGLVVAALGPRMLDLAGRLSDGTVTWMTGAETLRRMVVPRISAAAERAGRPSPRIIVGIPVCVTGDVAAARERLAPGMAGTARMASYQRMVQAEGVAEAVDIALIGDEDAVDARIDQLADAGATEVLANVLGTPEEVDRTRAFLAARA